MKKHFLKRSAVTLLLTFSLFACSDDGTEKILLSDVPENVLDIVQNALPGITLKKKAEREIKDQTMVYELEGKLDNGNEYEIKITETGTIVEIELED
jgi:uncharacterized membrane protein YkoI